MVLTTGEIGLVAVGATLVTVFATQSFERKRFTTSRSERWFNDRREAYAAFVDSVYSLEDVAETVTELLLSGNISPLPDSVANEYQKARKNTITALSTLRLLGSRDARDQAQRVVILNNERISYHPQFNKNQPRSDFDPGTVSQLYEEYKSARDNFINTVRKEFGVDEISVERAETMPDSYIVLAAKYVRKKMYESYIKSEIYESNKK